MTEGGKTASLLGAALLLVGVTWALSLSSSRPAALPDRNAPLFPRFDDPNAASSVEIVEMDEQLAVPRGFKVINQHGHWTIPSAFDYPADAKNRLARIAAALITMRKEDFVSASGTDYERLDVLDPADPALPGVKGRGTHITIRGDNEHLLADVVIGRPVAGHADLRYVRLADQKSVYISRVGDLQASVRFSDWIDPNPLHVDPKEIDAINIVNYSIDGKARTAHPREALLLRRRGDGWNLEDLQPRESVNAAAVEGLIGELAGLRIASVLPKPAGISAALTHTDRSPAITTADRDDLARKGFYLTGDGRLLSNEGEVIVHTTGAVFYTLRFGAVAPGDPSDGDSASGENRFLFVTATPDSSALGERPASAAVAEGRAVSLNAPFAPWYYVISAESLARIRLQRKDMVSRR